MHCKLIVLFLFLECMIFATTKRVHHDKIAASERNQSDVTDFVLVNPKQIHHAEIVIKHFLERLTGPITQPIILRSLFLKEDNLRETISEICKIIRRKIIEFAQASGLTISVYQYEETPWNSTISKDWFTESIVQGSLLLCDLVKVGEEIRLKIDHYFKTHNITLYKDEKLSLRKVTKSFKFLNTINEAAKFNEKLFNCLSVRNRKSSLSFDFIQIFANLTNDSPNNIVKSFKSSLKRAFVYSIPDNGTNNEQLCVLLCYLLVERSSHYGDCIKELQRLVACISLSRRDSHEGIIHYTFLSWLSEIENLSDCKVDVANNTININCNRKLPRTTVQQVKYIYEKILDRRIFERSPLHRVANDLGNVLSKSTWGRQLTYDVCQCFAIYEEGRRRLNALSKNATKNKKTTIRYKKLSASLNVYKNGILKEMMLTINNFHHSALEMQKFLTRVIKFSFKESWQNRIRIFTYLSEWMTKLLELFGYTNLNNTNVDVPITTTDISPSSSTTDLSIVTPYNNLYIKNNQHLVVHREKNQIKKETDAAFERLIRSMSDVKKIQSRNSNSTLAHLANNMLLIVIFMETLSFVSTLFSFGKYKDEVNPETSNSETEEWDSSERKRRSLFFSTNFAAVDTIKNDSLGIVSKKVSKKTFIIKKI